MINNKYFAIDCHCHIYPEKIASKAVGGTDAFYDSVSVGSGTLDDMLAHADRAGIDKALVQSVATTPHQVGSINRFIADEVARYPDRLIGFGTLHPASEDIVGDLEMITVRSPFTRPVRRAGCRFFSMRATVGMTDPIPTVLFPCSVSTQG